ncbi:MAG: asparagine synthetase B family protein [Bacteroidia bacterium]|nr:MAG: asparagine synthetase B family protein [Bacteroidia bacterium]
MNNQYIAKVMDLTNPAKNMIYNMTHEEAVEAVGSGNVEAVRKIDGQFSLVSVKGKIIRMARSIGRPLRYFIAKRPGGPELVVAERIDIIFDYLKKEGLDHQFHPSYTRMVPAHYITKIELLGCPDPNPVYERFFKPERNKFSSEDPSKIGELYIRTIYDEIRKWLRFGSNNGPLGVTFSAGTDSGALFLLVYHALRELGESPSRLKAFTLSIDGGGDDVAQARKFLDDLDLGFFLEVIEADYSSLDWKKTIRIVEDYKPLDIQSATMNLALLQGIRTRYPGWKYIIDGDGGNENLKDYPIEENPELTIRSVLNNLMLYHEGWGVNSIKHSLTYSGGLSRGFMRTYTTGETLGFETFSPYTLPNVIDISEGIPFIDITGWDHKKLYDLKGQIVSDGVKAVTGMTMPIFPKRRFQHGAASARAFSRHFPERETAYRKEFLSSYE